MKKVMYAIVAVLLAAGLLAGCTQPAPAASTPASQNESPSQQPSASEPPASPSESPQESSLSGKLAVVGSTSVGPLMVKIAEAFNATNPEVVIDIQQVGSGAGIQATVDGSADIGMASRELKEEEIAQGLVPVVMALDGIAVIVNNESTVSDLTSEQIQKIFMGEITNWKDVGGKDGEITVISREEGSGTRAAFEEILKLEKEVEKDGEKKKVSAVTEKALVMEGTGGVKAGVFGNPNAIGYISLGVADDTVKAVKVNGVDATTDNVKNNSYTVSRPFNVLTKGEPAGLAKIFMDYLLSGEAQALVLQEKYIPVK